MCGLRGLVRGFLEKYLWKKRKGKWRKRTHRINILCRRKNGGPNYESQISVCPSQAQGGLPREEVITDLMDLTEVQLRLDCIMRRSLQLIPCLWLLSHDYFSINAWFFPMNYRCHLVTPKVLSEIKRWICLEGLIACPKTHRKWLLVLRNIRN